MNLHPWEKDRLRCLAGEQRALAESEAMVQLRNEWALHGAVEGMPRPTIRIEINSFEHEILPPLMQCVSDDARAIEQTLLRNVASHMLFGDDTLVPPYYSIKHSFSFLPFGLIERRTETDGVGHHYIPYLRDLEADYDKLMPSIFSADDAKALMEQESIQALFGDILPAHFPGYCLISYPLRDIVHIMNMEDMYLAMLDAPERFHEMMERLTDDYLCYFLALEKGGHLQSAASDQPLRQASYCYANELREIKGAQLSDMWLYMDAQEACGISPSMFEEFVYPYYRKLMDRVGLVSYGCCEAVHTIWDTCLAHQLNIRRVSISPWCDEKFMGERLSGTRIVYLRKPSPNMLSIGDTLDEDAVRAHFTATVQAAHGCVLEFAQRDVYTVHNSVERVRRYVELARSCIDTHWRP